ncbi:MAG: hypothetical protein ABI663_17025 [Chryseolinea sp.]
MKNYRITSTLILLALLLSSASVFSQDYVITVKGDTIKGEVKPLTFGANSKVSVATSDKKKTSFTLFQVKAFSFKNEIYRPIKGPDGYTFMKLKKDGYLSLYAFQLPNQMSFDGYFMTKLDGSGIEVPNLSFKKAMKNFLSECASVADKIEKGNLGKRELDAIIDEYNACVKNNTINHEKFITQTKDQSKKISAWDTLEEKLKSQSDFEGKSNAVEMITDIKGKISRGEKVPNFLTEGLKNILNPTDLKGDLELALKEMQ